MGLIFEHITNFDVVRIFSINHYLTLHRHRGKGNQMNTKLIVKTILIFIIWIVMVLTHPLAYACTAFMASDSDTVLVGNNEDYNIPHTRVWFIPAKSGQYGRVYFGYDCWYPGGGMNDQGLFFDILLTETLEINSSIEKPLFKGDIFDKFMAECATVKEVLDLFDSYHLEQMSDFHLLVVDRTGDSVIIERDHTIRKTGSYQVVTNFLQSQVGENKQPCEWYKGGCIRYQTAEMMLKDRRAVSVEYFRNILEATHQHTLGTRTLYSNIYDLKNGLIYLYYLHNFDNEVIINLKEELKKGSHYYEIPSLYGKKVTFGKKEYIHHSPAFRISYPKHYEVVKPELKEVFRVKHSLGGLPKLSVSIDDKPQDIPLRDIGEKHYLPELKKNVATVRIISNIQTKLKDGTPANEVQFDLMTTDNWPVKILVLSTYHNDNLIYAAIQSLAFPGTLKEYLYSLRFD